MSLSEKIYGQLYKEKFASKTKEQVVEQTYRAIGASKLSKQKIRESLQKLIEDETVIVKNGIVKNNTEVLEGVIRRNYNGSARVVAYKKGVPYDYYVPKSFVGNSRTNDKVKFILSKNGNNDSIAKIISIERNNSRKITGQVVKENDQYIFIPNEKIAGKIVLEQNKYAKLAEGKFCVATVTNAKEFKKDKKLPIKLAIKYQKEVFGDIKDPMAGVEAVLNEYEVTDKFNELVENTAKKITPISEEEITKIRDLRHKSFVTIDPATCKDMDDAVLVEPIIKNGVKTGYKAYIAIADVSYYVEEGSVIDLEARKRGTSIYPAGKVVPMLPKKLSNDLCSLNPNEAKPVMVTEVDLDLNGEILNYDIYSAVINSKHKFAYEQVSDLYHNKPEAVKKYKKYKPLVDNLYEIRKILAEKAFKEGALPAKGYDPTIVLNEQKDKVIDFRNDNHVDSHDIIAQLMILNNRVVAKFFNSLNIPNLLRTHKSPSERKIKELLTTLKEFDIYIEQAETMSEAQLYANIAKKIDGNKAEKVLNTMLIRSMQKAEYHTNKNIGHFALGIKDYTHFTSPIRRYTDLVEHRLIKQAINVLKNEQKKGRVVFDGKKLSEAIQDLSVVSQMRLRQIADEEKLYNLSRHLNLCERTANEIGAKTSLNCMALYMEQFVGQTKTGYISKVDKNGAVVTLFDKDDKEHSDIIDVKISLKDLKRMSGGYLLNDSKTALVTKKASHVKYAIGNKVKVKITDCDIIKGVISGSLNLQKEKKNFSTKNSSDELTI